MRLRLISSVEIAPSAVMKGEVLFQADMGYQIDTWKASPCIRASAARRSSL